jgi:Protein of unknown function (DUF2917)
MIGMDLSEFRSGRHLLSIPRRRCVRLQAPAGVVVRCVSGEVWLTRSGSSEDVWLAPGSSYDCASAASLYIDSLGASSAIEVSRKIV